MQPGRLKVAMTSVIAALLVGALLLSVPVGSIAGRNNPSHFTETYLGGRSIKLFTGRNNTLTKGKQRQPGQRSGSKATHAEVQELLSVAAKEFEPWQDGISLEMVERLYCVPESMDTMRIQIIDGKPFLVGPNPSWQSRFRTMQKQILDVVTEHQIPDVDFIMSTGDSCRDWDQLPMSKDGNISRCERNAPLFSFCRHKYQPSCVMMPDFSFGGWPEAFMDDWQSTRSWMMLAAERTPFSKRRPKLFWRGGNTNVQRDIMQMSDIVQDSPVMDVHLVDWGDGSFRESFISLPEHCRYKQLLHLGGISYSARLRALMLCKSAVVFPYDYDWEPKEFWYHMLKDRENVMLTGDFFDSVWHTAEIGVPSWAVRISMASELNKHGLEVNDVGVGKVDDLNWGENVVDAAIELRANDTFAEEVGRRGQYLAAEILHPDNIQKYWVELLTQYSKLLTFKPKIHADATPLEVAIMQPEKSILSSERTCNVC